MPPENPATAGRKASATVSRSSRDAPDQASTRAASRIAPTRSITGNDSVTNRAPADRGSKPAYSAFSAPNVSLGEVNGINRVHSKGATAQTSTTSDRKVSSDARPINLANPPFAQPTIVRKYGYPVILPTDQATKASFAVVDPVVLGSDVATAFPETTAPKTTAPKTTAPKTTAPKTTAPKTTAPKTTAPNTTAAKPTAPNTAAPKTTAPKTTAAKPTAAKPIVSASGEPQGMPSTFNPSRRQIGHSGNSTSTDLKQEPTADTTTGLGARRPTKHAVAATEITQPAVSSFNVSAPVQTNVSATQMSSTMRGDSPIASSPPQVNPVTSNNAAFLSYRNMDPFNMSAHADESDLPTSPTPADPPSSDTPVMRGIKKSSSLPVSSFYAKIQQEFGSRAGTKRKASDGDEVGGAKRIVLNSNDDGPVHATAPDAAAGAWGALIAENAELFTALNGLAYEANGHPLNMHRLNIFNAALKVGVTSLAAALEGNDLGSSIQQRVSSVQTKWGGAGVSQEM